MQVELFYIAHADPCGRNIEKNRWSKNKDGTRTLWYSSLKGAKDWESGGRGIVPGALLKLLVKDKLPHSREVPVNAKEWQPMKPLRRENEDYSRKVLVNVKEWQLKPPKGEKEDYSGWAPISTKGWQVKPPKREKEDYSGWAPTSTKGWQLKPPRREKEYSHFRSVSESR